MPSFDSLITRHKESPGLVCGRDGLRFDNMTRMFPSGIVNTAPKVTVDCRLCQAEIPKGVQCFAWLSYVERPRWATTRASPGRSPMLSSGVRWFVHHECLLSGLESLAAADAPGCGLCNKPQETLTFVRRRSGLIKVCDDCLDRFPIVCSHCSHRVEATEASVTLTPFTRSVKWDRDLVEERSGVVCDGCAVSYRLDTVNTRRAAHRASRREWAAIRIAAEDAAEWVDGA